MPIVALGTDNNNRPASGGKKVTRGSGRRSVIYVDAAGRRFNAVAYSKGTSSGLKLKIESYGNAGASAKFIDNVPLLTTKGQTGRYINRLQ
jgi:hypothetical protein